jgi:uncharacterized OB-fold protein
MSATEPVPTADSEVFWERCKAGELCLPRCRQCGELNWFPRAMCRYCSGTDMEWVPMSGQATVYSFSVVDRPPSPDLPGRYVLALVDLDEGVRMMTHVVDCDPAEVRIGMRVSVRFKPVSDEISLPMFGPMPLGSRNG